MTIIIIVIINILITIIFIFIIINCIKPPLKKYLVIYPTRGLLRIGDCTLVVPYSSGDIALGSQITNVIA